jgi:hypothetical protein
MNNNKKAITVYERFRVDFYNKVRESLFCNIENNIKNRTNKIITQSNSSGNSILYKNEIFYLDGKSTDSDINHSSVRFDLKDDLDIIIKDKKSLENKEDILSNFICNSLNTCELIDDFFYIFVEELHHTLIDYGADKPDLDNLKPSKEAIEFVENNKELREELSIQIRKNILIG